MSYDLLPAKVDFRTKKLSRLGFWTSVDQMLAGTVGSNSQHLDFGYGSRIKSPGPLPPYFPASALSSRRSLKS